MLKSLLLKRSDEQFFRFVQPFHNCTSKYISLCAAICVNACGCMHVYVCARVRAFVCKNARACVST